MNATLFALLVGSLYANYKFIDPSTGQKLEDIFDETRIPNNVQRGLMTAALVPMGIYSASKHGYRSLTNGLIF